MFLELRASLEDLKSGDRELALTVSGVRQGGGLAEQRLQFVDSALGFTGWDVQFAQPVFIHQKDALSRLQTQIRVRDFQGPRTVFARLHYLPTRTLT